MEPIGPRFGSALPSASGTQDGKPRLPGAERGGGTKWYRPSCRSADCGENVTCLRLTATAQLLHRARRS
jgi:hypothetical protein